MYKINYTCATINLPLFKLKNIVQGGNEYDLNIGFIIAAADENAARNLANSRQAAEGAIWNSPATASCIKISESSIYGVQTIVLNSYLQG